MVNQAKPDQSQFNRGLTFGISAYLIWGSFPLIIAMLSFASPFEIVVWRIVFGLLLAVLLLTISRGWKLIRPLLRKPQKLLWVAVAAVFILINWQVYVIAVNSGQVAQSALGYFINPLVTILLAVLFLREKLRATQWVAVGLGAIAVIVLTFDYGSIPWIALTLAFSFGIYGLAKNRVGSSIPPLVSFTLESSMLLPLAIIQASIVFYLDGALSFGTVGFWGSLGLAFFGFMTAIPLIMFGVAAKNVPLRYIGFMQYLTPVLQFLLALLVFQEPMPATRWLGFGLVWLGLAVLSVDMVRGSRAARKRLKTPEMP